MVLAPSAVALETSTPGPPIAWEETNCPLCGSPRWSPFLEAPDQVASETGLWFAVVKCVSCNTCYTNPRPDAASIARFYPQQYRPFRRPQHRPVRPWTGWTFLQGRCSERRLLPLQGRGRLLDFGCGGGSFLERMRSQGWQVTGLDISADTVNRIRQELDITALQGTLPHSDLDPRSFDVLTMWHSLEHVHQPLEVLRAARDLLVPGGKIYIAVPNLASLGFRWFGRSWYGLDLPRHLTHFTPTSLRGILERAGFVVRSLRGVRHDQWLRASAQLACRQPQPSTWQQLLTLRPFARLAGWGTFLGQSADSILACAERIR